MHDSYSVFTLGSDFWQFSICKENELVGFQKNGLSAKKFGEQNKQINLMAKMSFLLITEASLVWDESQIGARR